LTNLLLVALGGAIGSSLRYLTSIFFKFFFNYSFIGTLSINVIGSFLIGLTIYYMQSKNFTYDYIKYFFIIGLLGSYTTFSAFSYETIELFINNKIYFSLINIIFSLLFCILAAYIGLNIVKFLN